MEWKREGSSLYFRSLINITLLLRELNDYVVSVEHLNCTVWSDTMGLLAQSIQRYYKGVCGDIYEKLAIYTKNSSCGVDGLF